MTIAGIPAVVQGTCQLLLAGLSQASGGPGGGREAVKIPRLWCFKINRSFGPLLERFCRNRCQFWEPNLSVDFSAWHAWAGRLTAHVCSASQPLGMMTEAQRFLGSALVVWQRKRSQVPQGNYCCPVVRAARLRSFRNAE